MPRRPCSWPRCPNTTRRGSGRCHVHRYADRDARDQEPTARAVADRDEAVDALRARFGHDLEIDATAFVSGACSLNLRWGASVAMVRSYPPDRWRVAVGPDGTPAGPDRVLASLDEVVDHLRARLASNTAPSSGT